MSDNFADWYDRLRAKVRREKAASHLATVEAEMGKTTVTLTVNGKPVAVVVLAEVTRSMDGTTALFRDVSHFMEHRRSD